MDKTKRLKLLLVGWSGRLPARWRARLLNFAAFALFKIWRPLGRFFPFEVLRRLPVSSAWLGPPKGLCRTTEEGCRASAGASYHPLRAAGEILREHPPLIVDGSIHEAFTRHVRIETPRTFVGVLPAARVYGDCGAVISPDDRLVADVSMEVARQDFTHSVFSRIRLPKIVPVPGLSAVAAGLGHLNYFHWMFDVLPRFELLREAGFRWEQIDHFLLGEFGARFQKESLAILGIDAAKVLACDASTHLRCERLLVPSLPGHSGHPPRWVCDFLRATFLEKGADPRGQKRLYISRAGARFRRVLNEDEVMAALVREGFEVVDLEALSVTAQAALFAEAEVIVAPHGAGLTNLVFCRAGTAVIEIFAPRCVLAPYWALSSQVGLRYAYLLGRSAEADAKGHYFTMIEDLSVDCGKLLETISIASGLPVSIHSEALPFSP